MDPTEFFLALDRPLLGENLFDHVPDIVHFIKDKDGHYISVNKTLVSRLGLETKEQVIGKKAIDLFPQELGQGFTTQDRNIIQTGAGIHGRLELHLYPTRKPGWCLTYKEPIRARDKKIIGIVGISRDIHSPAEQRNDLATLHKVIVHIRNNIEHPLRLTELAEMADLSVYQLDQRIRNVYQLSAGQFITQTRIEKACNLLSCTQKTIADIALDCGYSDQSAFSRQFKQTTSLTPKTFRNQST